MWYYDPFIMVPAVLTGIGLLFAILGTIALCKKHKKTSILCFITALPCVLLSTFVVVFGWVLNHEEAIKQWISTISL